MRRRRRLPRILLNAVTALSLVLCVAAIVLWMRSLWFIEGFALRDDGGQRRELRADAGDLVYDRFTESPREPGNTDAIMVHPVTILRRWTFSVRRPSERAWYGEGINERKPYPYRRWGIEVGPPTVDYNFPVQPTLTVNWHWEDDYGQATPSSTRVFSRFGVRVVDGYRAVPLWTDQAPWSGMVHYLRGRVVAIPFWILAGIFLILPAGRMMTFLLNKLREVRVGLCPACGYDLRATPDRCPECGAVPPPAAA